ncbi:MAG: CDP-glycerol glycerophosphotransferase family protein [Lachnospiraceae bacterium]|nr:CDP-glycerol glycerophosphotransferase family protein [Lachnospiraceae bacterium]
MNDLYDITVLYALHESDDEIPPFPAQSLAAERIQVLPIRENDPYLPWAQALASIPKAEGTYTILLDAGDHFPRTFLSDLLALAKTSGGAFVMPSQIGRYIKRPVEFFSLQPLTGSFTMNTTTMEIEEKDWKLSGNLSLSKMEDPDYMPFTFPVELHALLFPTQSLKRALRKTAGSANYEMHETAGSAECETHKTAGSAERESCKTTDTMNYETRETAGSAEHEKMILLELLRENPRFSYLGSDEISYTTPRECDHQYDIRSLRHEWYYDPFEQFLLPLLAQIRKSADTSPHSAQTGLENADSASHSVQTGQENADSTSHSAQAGQENADRTSHSAQAGQENADRTSHSAQAGQEEGIPRLLQYLALHMINIRFNANIDNRNKHVLETEEISSFTDLISSVLQYISIEAILDTNVHTTNASLPFRLTLLRMKKRDWSWFPQPVCSGDDLRLVCDGHEFATLLDVPLEIQLIDYRNGALEIDGSCPDYFQDHSVKVFARFGGEIYQPVFNRRYSLTKYFGTSFYRKKTFHISIPVDETDTGQKERFLNFYLKVKNPCSAFGNMAGPQASRQASATKPASPGEMEYRMTFAFPSHTSRFARSLAYGYWRFGKYISYHNDLGIHVRPSSPLLVFRKEVLLWRQILQKREGRKYVPLKMLNFALRPWFSRQKIWMFMDKIYKGGDSSEYIYKYATAQDDGIRKYYLLDKSSADYARLKKEGYHPLKRGSIRHRLIFLNANMVIASNSTVFAFNSYSTATSQYIRGDIHFDVACVQHGMSVQKIAIAQQRLRDNTKLYFCASKYEIENLSRPAYDYVGYDVLKLTGVPRYDGLKSRAQKILLFSPTWRMNSALPPTRGESVARDYNPHFKETSYYQVYNSLMNDPRLLDAARQYGYRIQYVLHPIISPQAEDFTRNDLVEIIPSIGDMSYEKLFCEAALMVTDFSGVQFDFAYMRKPVVYLHHHDIPQHYEEGSFFYDTMGFGEICTTNDELIDTLCNYMKNDCHMPDLYRQRADDFFAYSDNDNCARIYPIMLEHERSRQ